jgi:geranylgeranyl diphosphate synthase type I
MLDVILSRGKDYGDEDGILRAANLKTAWYTAAGPLKLGAVLAGAPSELLDSIKKYGMALGVAFQLRDDILGVESKEAETGKSGTSDIAEGKVTLLAHYAIKRGTPKQRERLGRIYGNDQVSEADRREILDIFEATGAVAETTRRAEHYLAEANEIIPNITQDPDKAELLTQLGSMMVHRKS